MNRTCTYANLHRDVAARMVCSYLKIWTSSYRCEITACGLPSSPTPTWPSIYQVLDELTSFDSLPTLHIVNMKKTRLTISIFASDSRIWLSFQMLFDGGTVTQLLIAIGTPILMNCQPFFSTIRKDNLDSISDVWKSAFDSAVCRLFPSIKLYDSANALARHNFHLGFLRLTNSQQYDLFLP